MAGQQERKQVGVERQVLRLRAGFRSQAALAEKAGIGTETVMNAELGRTLSVPSIEAIAAALGITPAQYLDPVAFPVQPAPVAGSAP